MDHVRISGTEPSSIFMAKQRSLKVKMWYPNFQKQLKPKGMM